MWQVLPSSPDVIEVAKDGFQMPRLLRGGRMRFIDTGNDLSMKIRRAVIELLSGSEITT